ncbi:hypothetical protein BPY_07050 [Bifidobacterium psychraerophilum]
MTWFKVDDGFYRNPKSAVLSDTATSLWLRAATWSCDLLTDGFVPEKMLPMFRSPQDAAQELCDAGLWEKTEGGWRFHDWFDYQPSAEEVEELKQKRKEAGRRGAMARWQNDGKPIANAMANAKQTDGKVHGKPIAKSCPVSVSVPVSNSYELDSVADARPEVMELCTHLADLIAANGSKRPTIGKQWLDSARLMLDTDHRTPTEAHHLIDWCQHDEFWIPNILSMPKFRKQYDTLRLQAGRSHPRSKAQQNQDANEQMVRRYAEDARQARQAEQLRLGA